MLSSNADDDKYRTSHARGNGHGRVKGDSIPLRFSSPSGHYLQVQYSAKWGVLGLRELVPQQEEAWTRGSRNLGLPI